MTNLTLAKVDLPESWIGASVGEPYLVRENLFRFFDIPSFAPDIKANHFEYSKPAGYEPLVKFLEDRYQAPVIIHNGAKQAIGSLFYALKKSGRPNIILEKPWWSLWPPLIEMHGCQQVLNSFNAHETAFLLVSPGNPDNRFDQEEDQKKIEELEDLGIPTIHDSAYYNHIYLPTEIPLKPMGDVQVFTTSKLLGLSQLRLGFSVFHNTDLYNDVLAYQEHMTVGVSALSQIFALNILKEMTWKPDVAAKFEAQCRSDFAKNRETVNRISSSILDIKPSNIGMFLWAQCHDLKAFEESKIVVADGTGFGAEGFIRMNLGLKNETVQEIVERLNDWKISES